MDCSGSKRLMANVFLASIVFSALSMGMPLGVANDLGTLPTRQSAAPESANSNANLAESAQSSNDPPNLNQPPVESADVAKTVDIVETSNDIPKLLANFNRVRL